MEIQLKEWGLINLETGEISNEFLILQKKTRIGGIWVRVYQPALEWLITTNKLRGETLRVLLELITQAGYQNILPSQSQIAQRLKMKQASVSRAYRQLYDAQALYKIDRQYYLNPLLCWKGSQKQLEIAIQKLTYHGNCLRLQGVKSTQL